MNRLLSLIMPLLLISLSLVISIFIFFDNGFTILFSQKRVGIDYTFFKMYKFRSMRKSTPNVATHLLTNSQNTY